MKNTHCPPLPSQRKWQVARLRRSLLDTVLPFSAHYAALFRREGIDADRLATADDLRRIPFTHESGAIIRKDTALI